MRFRYAQLCLSLFLLPGSALAQRVEVSYDKEASFAKYHTYSWMESKNPGSDIAKKLITAEADRQLATKGFRKVESDPDMLVVYNTGVKDRVSVTGYNYGYYPGRWGWYGWGGAGGMTTYQQNIEKEGTLVLDFVDAKTNELFWRGVAAGTVPTKQEKTEKLLTKAFQKMLKQYPPKIK